MPPTPGKTTGMPSAEILYTLLPYTGLATSPTTEILTSLSTFVLSIHPHDGLKRKCQDNNLPTKSEVSNGLWEVLNATFYSELSGQPTA
jgi:hypothetical protein